MRKIQLIDPPSLKEPQKWDTAFTDFIKHCLVKDPSQRPDVPTLFKENKKFFDKVKTKQYLKENLLKKVPSIYDRVIQI